VSDAQVELGIFTPPPPDQAAPGLNGAVSISGTCPSPVVVRSSLGTGWEVFCLLEEQVGTNWFLQDKLLVLQGVWPFIGSPGPGTGVIRLEPSVSGKGFNPPSLTYVDILGPPTVSEGTNASYYGVATFDNGVPVNFTNTVWTASSFSINSNGVFQAGNVTSNLPVTITNYYLYVKTNSSSRVITVLNLPSPTLKQGQILSGTNFSLQVDGVPNRLHRIEAAEALTNGAVWVPVFTNKLNPNGQMNFTIPIGNQTQRFYRARELE
jgi:hypothetical protein